MVLTELEDQMMALQPHSSGVKIQDPMLDHQDKYMMKAQVHVSKSSAISDIQALPRRKYLYYQVVNIPVIIAKDLKDEEKTALIKVLKSHKQVLAWQLFDIKGINPELCTHKILMEDDFKTAVQHQRRVNPKIHVVIRKEVLKFLDAGLIYRISYSPLVSPVHYVPKKGGFTVVENEEKELFPTRLVTGWRVYIDYRKLNDATRKDHFPLPFMDQMLERL
nr:reverse transcriptase domain-containing protein [Tanacetum cinerariifolium]